MSDDTELNGMEPVSPEEAPVASAPAPEPAPAPAASSGDFLSSTAGKVVLIVGAVLVLLVVAGIVGWFVLGPASLGGTGTPSAPVGLVSSTGTPAAPAAPAAPAIPTSSTVATLPVADITLRDVFSPRNPFTVIEPDKIAISTAGTSADETSTLGPDVVTVIDIKTVSGERVAVIAFGGITYTVGPGDAFGGHAGWTVVTVHATSVDVLMDDVTVNLPLQHQTK